MDFKVGRTHVLYMYLFVLRHTYDTQGDLLSGEIPMSITLVQVPSLSFRLVRGDICVWRHNASGTGLYARQPGYHAIWS